MKIPESIKNFVDVFSILPGIGPRQAIRLAFHLIHQGLGFNEKIIRAIFSISQLKPCPQCFYINQNKSLLCEICGDPQRNPLIIAVVEKETDLISIENTGSFSGHYLILGDLKKTGVLDIQQKLRLNNLKERIKKEMAGKAQEIIIAVNPTTYGDLNAIIIAKELSPFAGQISRLGRGIPTGGEIEFADQETLSAAIKRRG